jgi:hypothetical protein
VSRRDSFGVHATTAIRQSSSGIRALRRAEAREQSRRRKGYAQALAQCIEASKQVADLKRTHAQIVREHRDLRRIHHELRAVGAQLSNVAFNWSQRPGYVITESDCAMLRELREAWDGALAPKPEEPAK